MEEDTRIRITDGSIGYEDIERIYSRLIEGSIIARPSEISISTIDADDDLHKVVAVKGEEEEECFLKFKEEYQEVDNTSDNEEGDTDYVYLHIIEQAQCGFDRYAIIKGDEVIKVNYSDYNDSRICGDADFRFHLGSCSCVELQRDSRKAYTLFVKGSADFGEKEKRAKIPVECYEKIKKCLLALGCEIIESEQPKIEKTDNKVDYTFKETPTDEEIEEMISLVDLDTFNNIIRARMIEDGYQECVSKITKKWAKGYLKEWAYNKYRFYKIFGNKLTLENDIKVEIDNTEANLMLSELKSKFPIYKGIMENIGYDALKENNIGNEDYPNISRYFFEDKKVKARMSFTKFMSLYNNEEMNIEISKLYQNSGKAHLTISINPIDYLTVSINNSGWRSCHNFINGEWRNAGLSYMIDPTSLVSYRSNGLVDYKINSKNFKWNSKNWRQMIYVSECNSAIVFSRQYPNENNNLAKEIRRMMEEVVSNYYKGENKWKLFNHQDSANVSVEKAGLLYNDVDSGYNHKVAKAKDDIDFADYYEIPIGLIPRCISGNGRYLGSETSDIWES